MKKNKSFILVILFAVMSIQTKAQDFKLGFDHFAILVQDLEESSNFYLNIMGLEEIENKTEKSHIRWFAMGEKAALHVIEDKQHKVGDIKGVHLALYTDNLDGFITHLRENKIYFENWPGTENTTNDRPDGVRQIYLKDPNGYWIEVNEN